jgi:hypothetical protein
LPQAACNMPRRRRMSQRVQEGRESHLNCCELTSDAAQRDPAFKGRDGAPPQRPSVKCICLRCASKSSPWTRQQVHDELPICRALDLAHCAVCGRNAVSLCEALRDAMRQQAANGRKHSRMCNGWNGAPSQRVPRSAPPTS